MLKKLGKKITNNFGLKVLATLFAAVLWIVVVNIDDPVISNRFTTSVIAENTSYITSQNKYFEVLDGKNTVTFSASAVRSVLSEMSNSDFTATADMEKIEYDDSSERYRVPVTITVNRNSSKVTVSSKQLYLEVALEDLGTCQKVIAAETKGTVADGCAVGNLEIVGSNLLKISGPYSIVSAIDMAVATINVEGVSTDVTDSVVPVLYDADGNVMDTTKLQMSLDTVTVAAQILNTKDVALEFSTQGEVAEGYMVTGVEYPLETVRIKGESATLNTVNKITIPAEVLDVTDITDDLVTNVDISSYLPAGTSLVLSSDAKIDVTVQVEPIVVRTYEISLANVPIENLGEKYTLKFAESVANVEVGGAESVVAELKKTDFTGSIDMNGLGEGEHQVEVRIALPNDKCWLSEPVKVMVVIGSKEDADAGQDAEETVKNGTEDTETKKETGTETKTDVDTDVETGSGTSGATTTTMNPSTGTSEVPESETEETSEKADVKTS